MNTTKNLVKMYVTQGMPNYQEFYEFVMRHLEKDDVLFFENTLCEITKAGDSVKQKIKKIRQLVKHLHKVKSRKEQAEIIQQSYYPVNCELIPIAFTILDKKQLTKQQIEKLVERQLFIKTF